MERLHALTFNFTITIGFFFGHLWIFTLLKESKTAGQHLITSTLKEKLFAWSLGKKRRDEMENSVVRSASVCTRQHHCSLAGERGTCSCFFLALAGTGLPRAS